MALHKWEHRVCPTPRRVSDDWISTKAQDLFSTKIKKWGKSHLRPHLKNSFDVENNIFKRILKLAEKKKPIFRKLFWNFILISCFFFLSHVRTKTSEKLLFWDDILCWMCCCCFFSLTQTPVNSILPVSKWKQTDDVSKFSPVIYHPS